MTLPFYNSVLDTSANKYRTDQFGGVLCPNAKWPNRPEDLVRASTLECHLQNLSIHNKSVMDIGLAYRGSPVKKYLKLCNVRAHSHRERPSEAFLGDRTIPSCARQKRQIENNLVSVCWSSLQRATCCFWEASPPPLHSLPMEGEATLPTEQLLSAPPAVLSIRERCSGGTTTSLLIF